MEELESKIKLLPLEPGVYVMLDKSGTVIYVGKAKKLKNRVTQYFRNGYKTEKVAAMVMNIADFYYIITPSEREALTLENNLIKKYKPKYNILLKDDKSYPYIRVDLKETYPAFKIVRRLKADGAKYFGPFMLGIGVNDVLDIIKCAFKVRPCLTPISDTKVKKECLNYHLGLCLAPCAKKCTREEYMAEVKRAVDFLSGEDEGVEEILKRKMERAVENEEFETAVALRDNLKKLSVLKEKKVTAISRDLSADVIAIKSDGIFAAISVLFVRGGRVTGAKSYAVETAADETERLAQFIYQFYKDGASVPEEVILNEFCGEDDLIKDYLYSLKGKKVEIIYPKLGVKKSLADMCAKNAGEYLEKQIVLIRHKDDMTVRACERLKEILGLKKYPKRIECYDISHISGVDKVGSMVVFIDGSPAKSEYRRFKIKTVEGNNDFASLHEVLTRRLSKLNTSEEEKFPRPDLIVIDGGKGQLSAVKEAFDSLASDIEFISLAKREEEIFTPYSHEPVVLKKDDYALKVLQRVRDEAHRFAITFNRELRNKRTLKSELLKIEGIGKQKRDALIDEFKDIGGIISASEEDIAKVHGIGEKLAKNVKEYFKNGSN